MKEERNLIWSQMMLSPSLLHVQVFTPSSHLALTGFPGVAEPCPVWGEQTLVPAAGTAEGPQGHVRPPAASQHQRADFLPFHFKCKESSVPPQELSSANTQSPADPSPALSPVLLPPSPNYSCTCSWHSKSRLSN